MKSKMVTNPSANLVAGALAGIFGGFALAGVAQAIYSLTSSKKIAQETAIERRDPFIVLAEKFEKLTGKKLDEPQKKIFEQCVATALSATAGVSYALLAHRWRLNWPVGGLLFGGLFWIVEDEIISPAMGLVGNNKKYPIEAHLRGLAAHVVFGIVTAAFVEAAETMNDK